MNEADPSNNIETKLPILKTAGAAFAAPYRLRKHLLKAISLPFVISVALARALGPETDVGLVWVAQILLDLIPYTMFAVAWHRLILVGPENAAPTFVPSLTSRNWRFLIYLAILESLLLIGPIFSADILMPDDNAIDTETAEYDFDVQILLSDLFLYVASTLAVLLLSAPIIYVWVRFSFVFPATAVDYTWLPPVMARDALARPAFDRSHVSNFHTRLNSMAHYVPLLTGRMSGALDHSAGGQ